MTPLGGEYSYEPGTHSSLWEDGRVVLAFCIFVTAFLVFLGSYFAKPQPTPPPQPTKETPAKEWPAPGHDVKG